MAVFNYNFINEKKYEYTLENGLKIIIIPKKGFLKYFASFSTHFGAFNTEYYNIEKKEIVKIPNGVAHFLEHKMFEMPGEIDATSYFSDLGVDSNAFTDYNQTSYIISGTSNLEKAIIYLLDFVQTPYFTKKNVQKEKGIILQEYKMYKDQAEEVLNLELLKNMYANISYNEDIVGNEFDIKSITKEMLDDVYNAFYHPKNMLFCLVGDVNPDEIYELIKNNQSKKTFNENYYIQNVNFEEDNRILCDFEKISMDVVFPKISIGIKLPYLDYRGNENLLLEVKFKILLEFLLGSMSDSYQEMLDKEIIGNNFRYSIKLDEKSAFLKFSTDSKKPLEFKEYIYNKLKELKTMEIDSNNFDSLKRAFRGVILMSLNDIEYIGITYPEYYFKNCDLYKSIEMIDSIDIDSLNEVIELIDLNQISTFLIEKK